jgi:hypothetical protein
VTDSLASYLLARYDKIEQVALDASPGPWHENAESDEVVAVDGITVCDGFALGTRQLRATVAHIAMHDPAAVLRDVAAKRAIVTEHEHVPTFKIGSVAIGCVVCHRLGEGEGIEANGWCNTLKLLAQPFADRDDFREEWRA